MEPVFPHPLIVHNLEFKGLRGAVTQRKIPSPPKRSTVFPDTVVSSFYPIWDFSGPQNPPTPSQPSQTVGVSL